MASSDASQSAPSFALELAKMGEVVDWCAAHENRIGYFAAFFHRIMELMDKKLGTGHFDDDGFVHAFGVDLVDNYVSTVRRYCDGQTVSPAWQAALDACTHHPELSQVEYVLAQVRANAFVAMGEALARIVGSGGDLFAVRDDFVRVTDIPRGLLPGLADAWSKHLPVFAVVYALLHKPAVKVMRKAQREGYVGAWRYARSVVVLPEDQWAPILSAFHQEVVGLIEELVHPEGLGAKMLLGLLGLGEDADTTAGENRAVSAAIADYQQAKAYTDFTPMDLTDYD